jgi:VanZ family protein
MKTAEEGGASVPTRMVTTLAWLSVALVLVLSLSPPRYRMLTGAPRELEHFAAFALVGLMLALAYPERHLRLLASGAAAVAAIELLQVLVPGRHAYFSDFLLNVLGFCMGMAGALMAVRVSIRGRL